MYETLQWIMVAPDGTETLLNEEIVQYGDLVSWTPLGVLPHPFGKRRKGSEHDAAWELVKRELMEADVCLPSATTLNS
jgi:hypothetical protein